MSERNRLSQIGIKATVIYLIIIFTIIPSFIFLGWIELKPITLNEIGDFLAGLFGPLAIFWLVLGFFQQGDELRNSVETLKLQADELRNSVEQQKAMVSITGKQLDLDIQVRKEQTKEKIAQNLPQIQIRGGGISSFGGRAGKRYSYFIKNIGAAAASISLNFNEIDGISITPNQWAFTDTANEVEFTIVTTNTELPEKGINIVVQLNNTRGQQRTQEYLVGNFTPVLLKMDPE